VLPQYIMITTHIRVSKKIKKKLDKLVQIKGETYNDIIERLFYHYENGKRIC